MLVTILNHCEKENFVCMCVIEDHDESINVDLTSYPKKKFTEKSDLEFYGTGCASFTHAQFF